MIFRNGSLNKTIKGADRRGLTDAITEAAKSATASSAFSGAGHTLGGTPLGSKPAAAAGVTTPRLPMNWSFRGIIDAVINFIGMFLVSLFSLNGKKAAEDSRFNAQNQASRAGSSVPLQSGGRKVGEGPATLAKPPQKKFATLSDLNGS